MYRFLGPSSRSGRPAKGLWPCGWEQLYPLPLRGWPDRSSRSPESRDFTGAKVLCDLTVADIHTYYVLAGDTPVLVNDCGGGETPAPSMSDRALGPVGGGLTDAKSMAFVAVLVWITAFWFAVVDLFVVEQGYVDWRPVLSLGSVGAMMTLMAMVEWRRNRSNGELG